ncbi:unnamed protein product [Lactuca saligna]|uniref:Uncharacterized protein n=1 Tax=Lactuca saligna TaxID=75948 RepID=A0AA35ZGW4_LACSI|nr:unnamed protein product [Lactuca saligna]
MGLIPSDYNIHHASDSHKCIDDLSTYKCKNHECNLLEVAYPYQCPGWYRNDVHITFDRDARKMLDLSASDLVDIVKKRGDSLAMFPPELNVLKHRKAVFLVEVTTYNDCASQTGDNVTHLMRTNSYT